MSCHVMSNHFMLYRVCIRAASLPSLLTQTRAAPCGKPNSFSNFSLGPTRPSTEDRTPDPDLVAPHDDSALKVLAHPHAQLQRPPSLPLPVLSYPEFPRHQIPLLAQRDEVLVLVLGRRGHGPRDGADGHEAQEPQVRRGLDGAAQRYRLGARRASGLGVLARGVDLDVDVEFFRPRLRGS